MARRAKAWLIVAGLFAIVTAVLTPMVIERARLISREPAPNETAEKIVNAALAQLGTRYRTGYFAIDYPHGDLPKDEGVCTDVVIRALRGAGYDLQELIHKDMKRRFHQYPQRYGLAGPDSNIDHRRVTNQLVFMERFGQKLTTSVQDPKKWLPGDIVYWKMSPSMDHCGIVSNRRNSRGQPYVIHNGGPCREDDALESWPIIGHYRFPKR